VALSNSIKVVLSAAALLLILFVTITVLLVLPQLLAPEKYAFTFVVSGTPTFSIAFIDCAQASVSINSTFMSYSGAAHGKKFQVDALGGIGTQGAGVNFFPGDVAGTTSSIGFYT
jgi:hypothetical protein